MGLEILAWDMKTQFSSTTLAKLKDLFSPSSGHFPKNAKVSLGGRLDNEKQMVI